MSKQTEFQVAHHFFETHQSIRANRTETESHLTCDFQMLIKLTRLFWKLNTHVTHERFLRNTEIVTSNTRCITLKHKAPALVAASFLWLPLII